MTAGFSPELLSYFATREQQRQDDIAQTWPKLQEDVAAFVARFRTHAGHPDFAAAIAKLIREVAVAAYVRGAMHGQFQSGRLEMPTDDLMLCEARETTRSMPEQFPAWALVDGRTETEDDDG